MNEQMTCDLDYKAEYNRMMEKNHDLMEKLRSVEEQCRDMEAEFARMRAQLDIVYLIFGKR